MYFLGIDTSCYTTSAAVIDIEGKLIYDGRVLLEVPKEERGLRQSLAVFQHSNNLPKLISAAMEAFNTSKLCCIGVSTRPRAQEGSYMPVFTAGHNTARIISSCLKVPIVECSHQQGHIIAGAWSIDREYKERFLVYHISGGTTELLLVDPSNNEEKLIGGTEDLNAGQYIDRIGVSLGCKFPCGPELDKLSSESISDAIELPIAVRNTYLSFSGPESHVQRLISKSEINHSYRADIAKAVFLNITKALEKTIVNGCREYKVNNVLMVGGVASNSIIRATLKESKKMRQLGIQVDISMPKFSSDNAVGAAIYAKEAYKAFGGSYEQF
jgi:N6-L-threonylcarbamoyladenine synthase